MLKFNVLLILLLLLLINLVRSDSPASTLTLSAIIYDHHPSKNSNFENKNGNGAKGMVQSTINSTSRVPALSSNTNAIAQGCVTDPSTFQYFFTSKTDMNIPISYSIPLTYNDGIYTYANNNFFPIDNKGWDSSTYSSLKLKRYTGDNDAYHNFHYCLKVNSKFTYQGIETFNFNGDDDVWVFINNKLAVDIGGIHENLPGSVDLQNLGLTVGQTYNFDFFYCERHTVKSNMKIQTNIEVFCPGTDYCGVCQGSGSDCCSPDKCVGASANPCRQYKCPSPDTAGVNSTNYLTKCTYTEKTCPAVDVCTNSQCSNSTGSCTTSAVVCDDKTNQCLINKRCAVPGGCTYDNKCSTSTNQCITGGCDGQGNCVAKNCDGGNLCKVYSCDSKTGCVTKDLCPSRGNPCETPTCNINNGVASCSYVPITPCTQCTCSSLNACQEKTCNAAGQCVPKDIPTEDGNACTIGTCDPSTGVITQSLNVTCGTCQTCNAKSGKCEENLSQCNDGNVCTNKKCDGSGNCASDPVNCDDGNACTEDSCDTLKGCVHTLITCQDKNACQLGVCDSKVGCTFKQKVCESPAFCVIAECDENLGCTTYDRRCVPDNPRCQKGICSNETASCDQKDYDPKPFICNTKAVVSTSVIAGVTVAGAVAVGLAVFGGKKGYDYWKESKGNKVTMANSNPLYENNPNAGAENPLYTANNS